MAQTMKSNCHHCGYLCGFDVQVEGGRVVGLQPDSSRYPYDESIARSCVRWKWNLEELESPDRINYPLRRVGERGSGQWERVSWSQALDDIASRLKDLAAAHGPQTLASAIGGPHASFWPLHRFMNLFGSPNNMGIGQICWNPRVWMDTLAFGWPIEADIDARLTKAVFLWGTNPAESDNSAFWRSLLHLERQGIPLVVIDTRFTKTARHAEHYIQPRPGTDCVLALAMVNVIISEQLYDRDFVEEWCTGFEGLIDHVAPYSPSYAERVCGVPADQVREIARLFAQPGPTALVSGRGVDQVGKNTLPTHRVLTILRAITGNVDRKGAMCIGEMSTFIPEVDLEMSAYLSPEGRAAQLNAGVSPLQSYEGYDKVQESVSRLGGRRLPMRYLASAHPQLVWQAMVTGEPYPIRALICMATNPLVTYADTHLVYEALKSLDLLVVLEYYMTPTAQMADYVLPSAQAFERPLFQAHGGVADFAYGGDAAIEPRHLRRDDYLFFRELGIRLGQGDHWPDATFRDALRRTLDPSGQSWEEFCKTGIHYAPNRYGKHLEPDPGTGEPQGFSTPSGKVELSNALLQSMGSTLYPVPAKAEGTGRWMVEGTEPPTLQTEEGQAYPLTMITGARMQPYWASAYRNIEDARRRHPLATATVSAATAQACGFREGQEVRVFNDKGSATFVLQVDDMADGVISVEYGWWYPEEEPGEPGLSGLWKSNVNLLTSGSLDICEPLVGTWVYNGIPCYVESLAEPEQLQMDLETV